MPGPVPAGAGASPATTTAGVRRSEPHLKHRILTCGLVSAALFLVLAPLQALAAPAEPPPPPSYRQAVEDAYNLVKAAAPGDATNASRAVAALEAGTGTTQVEILSDLERRPPD